MIDEIRSVLHKLQNSVFRVQQHILHIMRISKHKEQVINLLSNFFGRFETTTEFYELVCFTGGSIVDTETDALFGYDVFSHVKSHDTGPDPTNLAAFH